MTSPCGADCASAALLDCSSAALLASAVRPATVDGDFVTYGSFCRIECAPIPYKHRHSERFKVLSCKIELFNSSIGHFAG